MKKPLFEKKMMAVLTRLHRMVHGRDEAVPIVLFGNGKDIITGCAFPLGTGKGCMNAEGVDEPSMSAIVSRIYRKGYVPMGLAMICTGHVYDETEGNLRESFRMIYHASESFRNSVLLVVDYRGFPYCMWGKGSADDTGKFRQKRVSMCQLKRTKGGAVWISRDSWISSRLKSMGEKVLP